MTSPPTPNDITDVLRDTAAEVGLRIWPDLPGDFWHGTVSWPDDEDPAGFVREAAAVGAKLLYLATAGEAPDAVSHVGAAFAHQGVIYRFAHGSRHEAPEADTDVVDGNWEDSDSASDLAHVDVEAFAFVRAYSDKGPAGETWPQALERIMGSRKRAARLEPIVDSVVEDPGYGRFSNRQPILERHLTGLNDRDRPLVRRAVNHRWEVFVEPGLTAQAAEISGDLLARHDLDIDMYRWGEIEAVVLSSIPDLDPQLAPFVVGAVRSGLTELREEVHAAANRDGLSLYEALDPQTRDTLGFNRRPAAQAALLEGMLADVPQRARRSYVSELVEIEQARNLVSRERRFATVGRALLDRGMAKTAAGRTLGISPAVLDRLLTTHRDDVTIDEDDYLSDLLRA
ncbi:hypothetical protein [Nocardioides ganghwensis]|uniref:Uncharacterized protein n=1 Tax=Nocardioides ganghwensis TaxID=252230 RepID=A0A4Q2S848_9ACTN|nr:hypothetical protein [Nocardioides ganghwensis]MBD3947564.1 hypothetical protein [Nocardioides ganghwensis]RYB99417.1 hypothetical protein EUA07_16455 [Nocardioides ganghwensis]